ncbi:hypothetical protein Bbelb_132870 [Branchiostoma belcheri]|nr:hypothetical protein Bbelb_132870 [Branchiostoma belcheri]
MRAYSVGVGVEKELGAAASAMGGCQVADRVVCANYGVAGNCCIETIGIRVKKCIDNRGDDFYAYCLSPIAGCDQAYCAGNQVPCHGDQVWSSAYGHCVDAVPEMTENPILHPPVIDLNKWKVTFTCEIRYRNDTDDGARFAVKFLFDYEEFQEVNDATQSPLDPTKKTVELDAKYLGANRDLFGGLIWSSKMGKTVSQLP